MAQKLTNGSLGGRAIYHLVMPLAAALAASFTAGSAVGMLMQLYLKSRGCSTLIIGLSSSAISLGTFLGTLAFGFLSDRFPRKPLLMAALLGGMGTVATLALLPPPSGALAAVFARAFFSMGLSTVAMSIVSGVSRAAQRGRNLSFVSASRSLGLMLGKLGGGFLLAYLGFRWSFAALAVLPLLGVFFVLALPETGARRQKRSSQIAVFRHGLGGLFLGALLRQLGTNGFFSLIYVYMDTLGIPPELMGSVSALNSGLQVLGMLVFGHLADRIGRRRVFLTGFFLSILVPLIFAFSRGPGGMALGFLTLGIAFSSLYIGSTAYIGDVIPLERQGEMLGLFESSRALGGFLGPILAGAISRAFGLRTMFLCMAGVIAVGFMLVFFRPASSSRH